jgi:hypothetical protein
MNAKLKEYDDREFAQHLNDQYGDVKICGLSYGQGDALREIDPTAFDTMMADVPGVWICDECGKEYEDEDEANECCKPDEDEEADEVQP